MPAKWYSIKAKADDTAEVWIYDQIGEDFWSGAGITAKAFSEELAALKVANLHVHINSPGGSVFDGQAIYNAITRHPATVTVYIDGLAASIASVIAMAGERVVMAANALFMIHDPWGSITGTADEMRSTADVLDKIKTTLVGAYTGKTGMDDAAVIDLMTAETWMTADEAQAFGFVDEVAGEMALAASFDLMSRFKNAPAPTPITEPQDSENGSESDSDDTADEPGSEAKVATHHPAPIL